MPIIFLSPSTQEWNSYVTGSGSEEYNMNLLADALVPYLVSNAIQYKRNTPDMTAASSIRLANQGYYDFYLALHSNASGEGHYGENRGILAFYYPGSREGERAAEIFVRNLKTIYPLPDQVAARPTTTLGEVRQPHCPAVLLEIGYHDNFADARWIEGNREAIARQLGRSLTEFFATALYRAHGDPVWDGDALLRQPSPTVPAGAGGRRRDPDARGGLRLRPRGVAGLVCGPLRRLCGLRRGAVYSTWIKEAEFSSPALPEKYSFP